MLKATPLLDDLAREPARAAGLSRESRSALLSRCAAILAALSALDEPPPDDHTAAGGLAEPERLLTVPEVAELLGFARGYVYELLRRGDIRALHHGKHWRGRPAAVAEFIRSYEGRGEAARSVSSMLGRITDRSPSATSAPVPRAPAGQGATRHVTR